MSNDLSSYSTAELLAAVRQREDDERAAKKAKLEAIQPIISYTFAPAPKANRFDQLWDNSLEWWRLSGTVQNREALREAGHLDSTCADGGMNYLYNKANGEIVMSGGGGRVYIGFEPTSSILSALADFIEENPDHGGDVTQIVLDYQASDEYNSRRF